MADIACFSDVMAGVASAHLAPIIGVVKSPANDNLPAKSPSMRRAGRFAVAKNILLSPSFIVLIILRLVSSKISRVVLCRSSADRNPDDPFVGGEYAASAKQTVALGIYYEICPHKRP